MARDPAKPATFLSSVILILLEFGLVLLAIIGFDQHDRFYLGEPLEERMITLRGGAHYDDGGEESRPRYELHDTGLACTFWIAEGSLTALEENAAAKETVESLLEGTTLRALIRTDDKAALKDPKEQVRIIGLWHDGERLIDKQETEVNDLNAFYVALLFPLGALFLLVILLIVRWDRRRAGEVEALEDT